MVRSGALRNWLLTFGASGAIALCGAATGILAARLLQPEGRGALAELLLWPGLIAGLMLLSLPHGLALVAARTGGERHAGLLRTALALVLALSVAGIALGWPALALLVDARDRLGLAQAYLALFLPVHFLALTLLGLDQGQQRFTRYNAIRLLPSVTYLLGLLALWLLGLARVETVIWAAWAGTAVTAFARLALVRGDLGARASAAEARTLLHESGLIHITAVIGMVAEQIDRIVVVSLFPDAAVGQYVVALTLASTAFGLVSTAFHTTVLPEVARCPSPDRAARLAVRRLVQTLLLSGALLLVMAPAVPFALPLLFGEAYRPAVPVCLLLLAAHVPLSWNGVAIVALRAMGDWRAGPVTQAIVLAAFLASMGLLGGSTILFVPAALLLSQLAGTAYLVWRIRRVHAEGLSSWLHAIGDARRSLWSQFCAVSGRRRHVL